MLISPKFLIGVKIPKYMNTDYNTKMILMETMEGHWHLWCKIFCISGLQKILDIDDQR
jgi:hypothetical protein